VLTLTLGYSQPSIILVPGALSPSKAAGARSWQSIWDRT